MKRLFFVAVLLLTVITTNAQTTIAEEGAWCWFADPRALRITNSIPGGTKDVDRNIMGYIDRHGSIKLTQVDWKTETTEDVLVRSYFQPDDHTKPSFIPLPDGRILVFYSRHSAEPCFYYRVSLKAGDATQWGTEYKLNNPNKTTYPNPFILSDDPTHIYLCWRGIGWHPTIAKLSMPDAEGKSDYLWGPYQMLQSTGARPYAKYFSNGKDKIYVAYTTGHPDNEYPNWLYMNAFDVNTKQLQDIDGDSLSTIGSDKLFQVAKTDAYLAAYPKTVVDHTATSRDWIWNMAIDYDNNPVIGMVKINQDRTDHNYYYARWTGTEWQQAFIANAGGHFHLSEGTEMCYSGGMAIDRDDPKQVYCSVPVNGVYEIWHYTLDDNLYVVGKEAITQNSTKNNVRPFVIEGTQDSKLRLIWMQGDYYYWMVNKRFPMGFSTAVKTKTTLPGTSGTALGNLLSGPVTMESGTAKAFKDISSYKGVSKGNFSISIDMEISSQKYSGTIVSGDNWTYTLNSTDLYPRPTIGDSTYVSNNKLATSDSWQQHDGSTDGVWCEPAKLGKWNLTIIYNKEKGQVTTYRNGLIDQRIDETNFSAPDSVGSFEGELYSLAFTSDIVTTADIKAQMLSTDMSRLSVPDTVRNNIDIPLQTTGGIPVVWTSSDESVITTNGDVKVPEKAEAVTLTATADSLTRIFHCVVLPRYNGPEDEIVISENQEGVELIKNGSFSASSADSAPAGWNMSDNTLGGSKHSRVLNKNNNLLFYARFDGTNSTFYSTYTYGSVDNYKLPLKADSVYTLKKSYGCYGKYTSGKMVTTLTNQWGDVVYRDTMTTDNNLEAGDGFKQASVDITVKHSDYYYLIFSNENSNAKYAIGLDNISLIMKQVEPSGIETVKRQEPSEVDDAWYSLDGRKLQGQPTQKGFYIHAGKKVVF